MIGTYLVTGARGHLGSALLRLLSRRGQQVRGLVLPGEGKKGPALPGVELIEGDVCRPESLEPLLAGLDGRETALIHTAGIVDISGARTEEMRSVNVGGTANVVELCRRAGIGRLVYVSSVHAIPEGDPLGVLRETCAFSPDKVVGSYAKTKAEATALVLSAARQGLPAVVVHPSGILGPYESGGNHLVQMVRDYLAGKLPACVRGGYDFVDVRDVAAGCVAAAERGRAGECYILSNRHYEVREVLDMVRRQKGGRKLPVLPMWMARAAEPLLRWGAQMAGRRALYTRYSLHALHSNDRFDHSKATAELGYRPRDLRLTVRDTLRWLERRPRPCEG